MMTEKTEMKSAAKDAVARPEADAGTVDYIDQFIAEWELIRPDLNMPRLTVLLRVLRLGGLLDRELASIAKKSGITKAQFQVLASLRRLDPRPQSITELGQIAILSSGSMTSLVDKLEGQGMVSRSPHPEDRRGILLSLTPVGRKVIDATLMVRLKRLNELTDALSDTDTTTMVSGLRKLLISMDQSATP